MPSEWWTVSYGTKMFIEAPDVSMKSYIFATREEARRAAAHILRICRRNNQALRWRVSWSGYDAMEYETFDQDSGRNGEERVCVALMDCDANRDFFGTKI